MPLGQGDAHVVDGEGVGFLDLRAGALDEVLGDEGGRCRDAVDGDLRDALVVFLDGREAGRRGDGFAFGLVQHRRGLLGGEHLDDEELAGLGFGALGGGLARDGEGQVRADLGADEGVVDDGAAGLELVVQFKRLGVAGEGVFQGGAVRAAEGEDGDFGDLVGLDALAVAFGDHLDGGFRDLQGLGEFHSGGLLVARFPSA